MIDKALFKISELHLTLLVSTWIQGLACIGRGWGEDNLLRNLLQNVTEWGKGSKNVQNCVTSLMNGPLKLVLTSLLLISV